MQDLDKELWELGVLAKTEHNEVAPAQHELAPVFTTTNISADHNQLTMELMQKIARKHGMVCLLHEKPFAGVNGSGKHNNWSISTDAGVNLLEPGETPSENAQFCCSCAPLFRQSMIIRICCVFPWLPPATTTGWARTKRRPPLCPCSSARN